MISVAQGIVNKASANYNDLTKDQKKVTSMKFIIFEIMRGMKLTETDYRNTFKEVCSMLGSRGGRVLGKKRKIEKWLSDLKTQWVKDLASDPNMQHDLDISLGYD